MLDNPHIFLDQIMRQAAESEIIQMSMKIRNREPIPVFKGKDVMVIDKKELVTGHLLWADTIICATNDKRQMINKEKRKLLGLDNSLLSIGDKILLKRNYWDDCDDQGNALVNGSIATVNYITNNTAYVPRYLKTKTKVINSLKTNITLDGGGDVYNLNLDINFLMEEKPCIDTKLNYTLGKMKDRIGDIVPKVATYGYALTGHAAQGSEWDKVLVIEENFPFDREEHARWLYTACTRSSDKLVLVKK